MSESFNIYVYILLSERNFWRRNDIVITGRFIVSCQLFVNIFLWLWRVIVKLSLFPSKYQKKWSFTLVKACLSILLNISWWHGYGYHFQQKWRIQTSLQYKNYKETDSHPLHFFYHPRPRNMYAEYSHKSKNRPVQITRKQNIMGMDNQR